MHRSSECHSYGHECQDCARPHALSVGRGVNEEAARNSVTAEEETERASENRMAAPLKSTSEMVASLQRIVKTCQSSEGQQADAQRYSIDPEATEKPTAAVSTTVEPSCDPEKCDRDSDH